jgi:hypothetical protein
LTFSCKTRGFCPSCHAKRLEEWGEWVREALLLDVPHRQVVMTIPKTLRIFFKFRRRLLGELCRADGLSGVHRPGDVPYPRQGPGHGPRLGALRQRPPGQGQDQGLGRPSSETSHRTAKR